ncbi:MAG: carboxypeptidase-like regulatory domain-containing protein [Bacteroidetes bacterium]|nr:carboxypeptidase-like regulatory domain-containing protein [Bacteroidota bacterium]
MKHSFRYLAILYFVTLIAMTITSCKKEGTGGKSSVSGSVKHHSRLIPNAIVYIKYGATEFPGTDISKYDDHVTSDADAHYEFKDLRKGDYYLYGAGYDTYGLFNVTGGVGIKLKYNKSITIDVPVTE